MSAATPKTIRDRFVNALGYIGFTSAKGDQWRELATGVLGLQEVSLGYAGPGQQRYRVDERDWRISIEEADREGLAYVGWETRNENDLAGLVEHLRASGVDVTEEKPELATRRGVAELASATDPDGNRLEFYWGQLLAPEPFRSPVGAEFVSGELGLGHLVWRAQNFEECVEFYQRVLNFGLSDSVAMGGREISFLHVNRRHHSFALIKGDPNAPSVSHVMLEVATIDMVGIAQDRALDSDHQLYAGLGRHTNDEMISFYVPNPSGFNIEYGWGGRLIDVANHVAGRYNADGIWGHRAD